MATLADLGVQVRRTFVNTQTSLGAGGLNVSLSGGQSTRMEMTLPKPVAIRASFRKESWGDAVVKLFKKELQTGDKEFDKLVYITTDTPEETAAFLQSPETRAAVSLSIESGGPIEIEGTRVVAHSIGHDAEEDPTIVRIVAALLNPVSSTP